MDAYEEKLTLWLFKRWAGILKEGLDSANMELSGKRYTWTEKVLKDDRTVFTPDFIGAGLTNDQAKIDSFYVDKKVSGKLKVLDGIDGVWREIQEIIGLISGTDQEAREDD